MARLNDVPQASSDSVDALKRRFLRQNREIARVNSTQSLRIRNLESEISRLLSENLSLREEIIELGLQNQQAKETQRAREEIFGIKSILEQKLQEVETLVGALGQTLQTKSEDTSINNRRRSSGFQRRVEQRNSSRGGMSLGEVLASQEGRLPIINEDKYYPRRTLETEDLAILTTSQTPEESRDEVQSPEIGPPPIAHLDDEHLDAAEQEKCPSDNDASSSRRIVSTPMLENRKKRRDSTLVKDLAVGNEFDAALAKDVDDSKDLKESMPLKSGAKRKLSVRDDEAQKAKGEPEAFPYTRRSESEKAADVTRAPRILATGRSRRESTTEIRKALGPKTSNSAASPVKVKIGADGKAFDKSESAASIAKDILQQTRRKGALNGQDENVNAASIGEKTSHPADSTTMKTKAVESKRDEQDQGHEQQMTRADLPPKTPAALDILSPPSTQAPPSDQQASSRDTPPPGFEAYPVSSGLASLSSTAARPSRRQRSAVSYAEPNLRDKMRRPGKELVDAVTDKKILSTAVFSGRTSSSNAEINQMSIKKETNSPSLVLNQIPDSTNNRAEFNEPTSPLSKKSTTSNIRNTESNVVERRRLSKIAHAESDEHSLSGAANAISKLSLAGATGNKRDAGSSRAKDTQFSIEDSANSSSLKTDESVFDPPSSSPPRVTSQSARALSQMRSSRPSSGTSTKERRSSSVASLSTDRASKPNRRHSTNLAMSNGVATDALAMKLASTSLAARTNRRKKISEEQESDSESRRAVYGSLDGASEEGRGGSVRASSRRRSMML